MSRAFEVPPHKNSHPLPWSPPSSLLSFLFLLLSVQISYLTPSQVPPLQPKQQSHITKLTSFVLNFGIEGTGAA
ncbi:hypothetical protein M758_9G174300 [Ceratodon purpureus]|nr:hypothetical protein M758_9G174300 [Ceratodon purpureus]